MIEALGGEGAVPINLNAAAPVPILMVGLQGSGKTTTSGKLALRLPRAADAARCCWPAWTPSAPPRSCSWRSSPNRRGVPSLPIVAGQTPVQIAQRAMDTGRREGFDIVILDTAGRLSIDEALMDEVAAGPRRHQPGRDAAGGRCDDRPGRGQHRQGVQRRASASPASCMTRMDGDARGGAALSMRAITGAPIKLIGVGEKQDALEDFHPERVAGRILGHGRHRRPGRARGRDDRPGGGRKARRQDDARASSTWRTTPASSSRSARWAACRASSACCRASGKIKAAARGRRSRHQDPEAPGGDHLVDDDRRNAARRTSSRPAARSASPPAPAPRCRKSTGC